MPAIFNLAALTQSQGQGPAQGMSPASRSAAQQVPQGQARLAMAGAASGAAPFGAGAPMATGAVTLPSAWMPVPAAPPVVSTSQTGRLAAAAINGLNREPMPRKEGLQQTGFATDAVDSPARPSMPQASLGLPGGPAPAAIGGTAGTAGAAYAATQTAWGLL